ISNSVPTRYECPCLMRMRSTCLRVAISCFAFSKTGFESHGSMSRIFPLGVTILKADWPYHVSCVSMRNHEIENGSFSKCDEGNDQAQMTDPEEITKPEHSRASP